MNTTTKCEKCCVSKQIVCHSLLYSFKTCEKKLLLKYLIYQILNIFTCGFLQVRLIKYHNIAGYFAAKQL